MGSGNERGPGNEPGALTAEQFPHLGNYTLTPGLLAARSCGVAASISPDLPSLCAV